MSPSPRRIVSMLASATELVCELGLGEQLVGRSHECDHPEWVKRLPVVSRPTFDISGSSRDIDALVRERLRSGAPLYAVDEALLTSLVPDIVLTQTHCEVCAVSPADLAHGSSAELVRQQVVALSAGTLAGILDGFIEVARVLDRIDEGRALVARLQESTSRLRNATSPLPKRSVVCLEWSEPIFAMGNWGPELVELAGGENLLGAAGQHSTTTPWEDVIAADPDVLVVAPCGFGLERAIQDMPLLAVRPGWSSLRAVKSNRVFVADGNLYFNRSSPHAFESAEVLAEMLHPETFPPRHEGAVWVRWS
jgi:iron complex transport system substrate-binding protein